MPHTARFDATLRCRRVSRADAAALAELEESLYPNGLRAGRRQLRSELAEAEWDGSSFCYGLFFGGELVGAILAYYEPDCRRIFGYFDLECPSDITAEECIYVGDFMVRPEFRRYTLRLFKQMRAEMGASHATLPLYGFSTREMLDQWQKRRYAPKRAGYRYTGQRRFEVPHPPHELFLVRFDPRHTIGERSADRDDAGACASALKVSVASTHTAWMRLASDWDALRAKTPGATALQSFAHSRIWWERMSEDGWPLILVVHDGDAVRAIAPFWVQTQFYLGRARRLLKLIGELGELGSPTILRDGDDRAAVAAVFAHLFANTSLWDSMLLHEQPKDGVVLAVAREHCDRARVISSAVPGPRSVRIDTRGAWHAYLAPRPAVLTESLGFARQQIAREGEISFATHDTWPELVAAFETYQRIEASAPANGGAAGERRRAYETAVFYEYGPKRRLRVHTLAVGGRTIAASFGLCDRGRYLRMRSAHFPEYARFALDRALIAYEIEDAHKRADCESFELVLPADEAEAWTASPVETEQLYVYRRDPLFLAHYAWYFGVEPVLKRLLRSAGLLDAADRGDESGRAEPAAAKDRWRPSTHVEE